MRIIVVGNGVAGITAARFIRKLSDYEIIVISDETEHFFSRTALMYIYMGHMRYEDTKPYADDFWEKNRIELIFDRVTQIDFPSKQIHLNSGPMHYDKLILATGSTPNYFGWPGQDLERVGTMYSYPDLEQLEQWTNDIERGVVVGGGLIGIELAEMLVSRGKKTTLLVRESSYWDKVLPPEESRMVSEHIREHHIDLQLETELEEIIGDDSGAVKAVSTSKGEKIKCEFVGLTTGVSPNVDFLKGTELEINKGILVDEYLRTNIPDVYAIGDCAEIREPIFNRRPIEAIWYTGRIMGETVAYNICGKPKNYNPGTWFNSAKFFDIEYQVYGEMPVEMPQGWNTVFYKVPNENKSIRIYYDKKNLEVKGFNLMGVRFRHEVCAKWIESKTQITRVVSDIKMAFFDPEWYKTFEKELAQILQSQIGRDITPKSFSLKSILNFIQQ